MIPELPDRKNKEIADWEQLIIGIKNINEAEIISLIEQFWSIVVPKINLERDIFDIEPWFHVRRVCRKNKNKRLKIGYALSIEIFRLKKNAISSDVRESIRNIFDNNKYVLCAGWRDVRFAERHGIDFLSFLQKLSILRVIYGITYPEDLGDISDDYSKCRHCQKAFMIMVSRNRIWYDSLNPWFNYFNELDSNMKHEYAHWFGHIISIFSPDIMID